LDGELAREFEFSNFQIQQVRSRLGIPRHVPDRSEMDAMPGMVTDLQIGSTLGIAQPVVSKLRLDRGIPSTRDALNWTSELQALQPRLSDEALAGCGLVQIQAIRRGEQVLTNKTLLSEIADLLGVWSDEDLAAQHGGTPHRYVSAAVSLCACERLKLEANQSVNYHPPPLPHRRRPTMQFSFSLLAPHQLEVRARILDRFKRRALLQVHMACGTGEIRLVQGVAAALGARSTVIFLPSLALVSKTLQAWVNNAELDLERVLCVCSDESVATLDDEYEVL